MNSKSVMILEVRLAQLTESDNSYYGSMDNTGQGPNRTLIQMTIRHIML
jgi:hypothetical protein